MWRFIDYSGWVPNDYHTSEPPKLFTIVGKSDREPTDDGYLHRNKTYRREAALRAEAALRCKEGRELS